MLAIADAVEINGIYYNLVSKAKEAHVTQHPNKKYKGEIAIPETVEFEGDTYIVTSIEDKAFQINFGLTSVTIPESVKSIGQSAFQGCTELVSVTIPNSVTSINRQTFWMCGKLGSIKIPESVTYIGVSAFAECIALSSIDIPNSVSSIDKLAFYRCYSLTEVTIPNSVTSLGNMVFKECTNLVSVNIPNSLVSISQEAFEDCTSLSAVIIPNSINTIDKKAFYNCKALTTVTIGSGTNSIQSESFASCSELKDVYCYAENVPYTYSDAFKDSYTEYAILYVPAVSVNSYKQSVPWNAFKDIVAMEGSAVESLQKTKSPIIRSEGGTLTIEGVSDNEIIDVYTLNCMHRGSTVSQKGIAHLKTNLKTGNVAIVKIGNKSFKVVIQ